MLGYPSGKMTSNLSLRSRRTVDFATCLKYCLASIELYAHCCSPARCRICSLRRTMGQSASAQEDVAVIKEMKMACGDQHRPGAGNMFQALDTHDNPAPADQPTQGAHQHPGSSGNCFIHLLSALESFSPAWEVRALSSRYRAR